MTSLRTWFRAAAGSSRWDGLTGTLMRADGLGTRKAELQGYAIHVPGTSLCLPEPLSSRLPAHMNPPGEQTKWLWTERTEADAGRRRQRRLVTDSDVTLTGQVSLIAGRPARRRGRCG